MGYCYVQLVNLKRSVLFHEELQLFTKGQLEIKSGSVPILFEEMDFNN